MTFRLLSLSCFVCLMLGGALESFADELYLHNHDRITGTLVSESEQELVLESPVLGRVVVPRQHVERIVLSGPPQVAAQRTAPDDSSQQPEGQGESGPAWKKEFSCGYSMARGNTEKMRTFVRLSLNRKTKANEFTVRADHGYSSTDKKMDAQRFHGMIRYAFSFSPSQQWYNFYRLEGDHDRFANVDTRLTPFTGLGYWFSDQERIKWMMELGAGCEYTEYMDTKRTTLRSVLTPRVFFEKTVWGKTKISQDVTVFVSTQTPSDYRIHAEAALTAPLTVGWSLRMSIIDDFNSEPGAKAKRNDLRLISSLVYSF